jgi:hypothetical protein
MYMLRALCVFALPPRAYLLTHVEPSTLSDLISGCRCLSYTSCAQQQARASKQGSKQASKQGIVRAEYALAAGVESWGNHVSRMGMHDWVNLQHCSHAIEVPYTIQVWVKAH